MIDETSKIEEILAYWFGDLKGPHDVDRSKNKLWWMGGEDIDAEVTERFELGMRAGLAEQLLPWTQSARGCLALVILLDQFTRTINRGTAEAYAGDAAALRITLSAIDRRLDRQLRPIERSFLYMPMMHAEDRDMARRSTQAFEALSREIAELEVEDHPDFLSPAVKHAEIVVRFGRYPHRNELLGRPSTPEEEKFMADGGATFGQEK